MKVYVVTREFDNQDYSIQEVYKNYEDALRVYQYDEGIVITEHEVQD